MRTKTTLFLLFATFLSFTAKAQLKLNRDSTNCTTKCTDQISEDTIGFKNTSGTTDTFRWRTVSKRMPANWNWIICDPRECSAPDVSFNWFTLAPNEVGNIKFDYGITKGKDSALVYVLVFKSMDSANTVKTLKFAAVANCPASSLKLLNASDYSYSNNTLYINEFSVIEGVQITTIGGRMLQNHKIQAGNAQNIDFTAIDKGIYLVTFNTSKGNQTIKVLIQ